ncbi:hypothetical protein E0494_01420 [Marinilabiliaceae bacterium JC040]|nr:hypothetical protein [Marinilabiliaceae bacterium JC040]
MKTKLRITLLCTILISLLSFSCTKKKDNPIIEEYTVNFETNGGNKIESITVKDGEKVTKPTNPTKAEFNFIEWQLEGVTYDFNTPVKKDITLTAIWTAIPIYTVTFDTDEGSKIDVIKLREGLKITKPEDPVKDGFNFIEWQLEGIKYDFNTPVKKDITLRAIWKAIPEYTITFNTNGGSKIDAIKVREGLKITKPEDPKKDGYRIIDWQVDGKSYNFDTPITKDITISIIWETNGSLENWDIEDIEGGVRITKYKGTDKNLIIPARIDNKKVVEIGTTILPDRTYDRKNTSLENLDMSLAVYLKVIKHSAFIFCGALKKVTFSQSLVTIEYSAFGWCSQLGPSIIFPDSLEIIEGGAFRWCNISNVVFGKNLREIKDNKAWAAFGDNPIEIVDLSNTKLETIGKGIFFCCGRLRVIKFPSTLKIIGNVVTLNSSIEEIYIGRKDSPLTILDGTQAFVGTSSEYKGKIYYPKGTNYPNEKNWKDFTSAQWIEI